MVPVMESDAEIPKGRSVQANPREWWFRWDKMKGREVEIWERERERSDGVVDG